MIYGNTNCLLYIYSIVHYNYSNKYQDEMNNIT